MPGSTTNNGCLNVCTSPGAIVSGNGIIQCWGNNGNPVLENILVVAGYSYAQSVVFDASVYQTAADVGTLTWSLVNAPLGISVDPITGRVTINKGVTNTSIGVIRLAVSGRSGRLIQSPLTFNVSLAPRKLRVRASDLVATHSDGSGVALWPQTNAGPLDYPLHGVTRNGATLPVLYTTGNPFPFVRINDIAHGVAPNSLFNGFDFGNRVWPIKESE